MSVLKSGHSGNKLEVDHVGVCVCDIEILRLKLIIAAKHQHVITDLVDFEAEKEFRLNEY